MKAGADDALELDKGTQASKYLNHDLFSRSITLPIAFFFLVSLVVCKICRINKQWPWILEAIFLVDLFILIISWFWGNREIMNLIAYKFIVAFPLMSSKEDDKKVNIYIHVL